MAEQSAPNGLSLFQKVEKWLHTRRAKRIGIGVASFIAVYGLFGFFIAPSLIKNAAEDQLTTQLKRPSSIQEVVFNPFTLRLQVDEIHVGGREEGEDFFDVGQFMVRMSWSSLVRFTPVIAELAIHRPSFHIVRTGPKRFNFSDLVEASSQKAEDNPKDDTGTDAVAEKGKPLNLILDHFVVADGSLKFTDQSGQKNFTETLEDLTLDVNDISITGDDQSSYSFATNLENGGKISVDGNFNVANGWADTKLVINALAVSTIQPYLKKVTTAKIRDGLFGATLQARADWSKDPFNLTLRDSAVSLNNLKIAKPDATEASLVLPDFGVDLSRVDLASKSADVAMVKIAGLSIDAVRLRGGDIDLLGLIVPAKEKPIEKAKTSPTSATTPEPPVAAKAEAEAPWKYTVHEVAISESKLTLLDEATPSPAKIRIAPLNVTLKNIDQDFATPFPVSLDAILNVKGAVTLTGDVAVSPLDVNLKLDVVRLDLAPFGPYVQTAMNAKVASAFFTTKGDIAAKQADGAQNYAYKGDLALTDVRMLDFVSSDLFAGWSNFALKGIKASFDTVKGVDVDTRQVLFTDFQGHVLLDEKGRLHLQDVVSKKGEADDASDADEAKSVAKDAPKQAEASAPSLPVRMHFGQLRLKNGRVEYTDNFIQPNYKAKLQDISGTIGSFGTHSKKAAPVDVKARLAANGPIAIKGKVNPLITPPSLDMTASATGIELTNLTAYSAKYIGYPIQKGKLNVGLSYKLENDKLEANNNIFIDRLTFGQRVENDTATSLPVLFAINLMTNPKGQIDIDIPVSGSLDDPDFSIGGLIFKAIGNLIVKAITSPFSLLANAFGVSGEELDYVQFEPGTATLSQQAKDKLDTLVKMLKERPSIQLSLTGYVDPEQDEPALRHAYVQQQVLKQKLGDLVGKDGSIDPSKVQMTDKEYAEYLEDAYGDADFDRPRNVIGLLLDQPVPVMEKAMYDNAPITDSSLKQLGLDRVQAVREYLKGKVDETRVFTAAPEEGNSEAAQSTRVNFALQ